MDILGILLIVLIAIFLIAATGIPLSMYLLREKCKQCQELKYALSWVVSNCDIEVKENTPDIIFKMIGKNV